MCTACTSCAPYAHNLQRDVQGFGRFDGSIIKPGYRTEPPLPTSNKNPISRNKNPIFGQNGHQIKNKALSGPSNLGTGSAILPAAAERIIQKRLAGFDQSTLWKLSRILNTLESNNLKLTTSSLAHWSDTRPNETLTEGDDFRLGRYSSRLNVEVFEKVQNQKDRLQKYLSWPQHLHKIEDQQRFSDRAQKQWEEGLAFHFQIFYRDLFVGGISLHSMNYEDRSFEFGYWVDQEFEARGFVTRGLHLLLRNMASKGWKTAKITSKITNQRSRKIAERLGMVPDTSAGDLRVYRLAL